jgi:transcription elongation factor Elf1
MDDVAGAWVKCPRCGGLIGLSRFAESDDERRTAVAVCTSCGERVDLDSGG